MPKRRDVYAFKGTATLKNGEVYNPSSKGKKMPPRGISAFGIPFTLDILFYPSEMADEIKRIWGVQYDSESNVYYLRKFRLLHL